MGEPGWASSSTGKRKSAVLATAVLVAIAAVALLAQLRSAHEDGRRARDDLIVTRGQLDFCRSDLRRETAERERLEREVAFCEDELDTRATNAPSPRKDPCSSLFEAAQLYCRRLGKGDCDGYAKRFMIESATKGQCAFGR
jgi:hypothetical protein